MKISPLSGNILVVDDDDDVRHIMQYYLKKLGMTAFEADRGDGVIEFLQSQSIDLIILDIMMPGINGVDLLKQLKADERFSHIPVIMCSAINQPKSIAECLQLGAEDYVPKPFDKIIFQARIKGCIERTFAHRRETELLSLIQNELNEARDYVATRLPAPITEPLTIEYEHVSSSALGGDTFGFRAINDDYFAIFLADVSGHGIGSALYAASINDFFKHSITLKQDFYPADVTKQLNKRFKMDKRAGKYFTLWYGVYQFSTTELTYICCGHPPALLKRGNSVTPLSVGDIAITGFESEQYDTETINIQPGDDLLIFSDGIYETKLGGAYQTYHDFQTMLSQLADWNIETVTKQVYSHQSQDNFEDDVSLLHAKF